MSARSHMQAVWPFLLFAVLLTSPINGEESPPKGESSAAASQTGELAAKQLTPSEEAFRDGYAAHRRGNVNQAIESYSRAILLDPSYVRAYNNRGLAYQSKGKLDKAIADFTEAIRLSPKLTTAYMNRGTALMSAGDAQGALADFEMVVKLEPKAYRAYKMKAAIFDAIGDRQKAMENNFLAMKCYQPRYKTIAHRAIQTELEVKNKDYLPNYEFLDTIIDQAKANIPVKSSYTEDEALAVLRLIDELLLHHHFIIVEQGLLCDSLIPQGVTKEMLKRIDPRGLRFRLKAGDVVHFTSPLAASIIYAAVGDALGLPIRVATVPGHAFVRWPIPGGTAVNWETMIGSVRSDAEYAARMHISEKLIKDGVYLTPLSPNGVISSVLCNVGMVWSGEWYGLGDAYQGKDEEKILARSEKAIAAVTRAIVLNKKSYEAYIQRGMYLSRVGQQAGAISDNTRAIMLDPDQATAYLGRGMARLSAGQVTKAMEDLNKTIELNPNIPGPYYFRGLAKMQNKEVEGALVDLDKATELAPRFYEAYQAKAKAWESLGKADKAMAELKKLKQLQQQQQQMKP